VQESIAMRRRATLRTLPALTLAATSALYPTLTLGRPPAAAAAGWQPAGLGDVPGSHLVVDRSTPGVIYAGLEGTPAGRGGLRKTLDGGRSWISLERGLPSGLAPTALAVSPDGGRVVLVAGAGGLFRSTTGGTSWSAVRQPLPPVTALLFDREDAQVVLAGTELHGNFRSTNGGLTWRPAAAGLPEDRYGVRPGAVHLVQHPTDRNVVYMGTNGFGGVYRSDDQGLSWRPAGDGLPSQAILGLATHPETQDSVFALTEKGLTRSDNRGGSWQTVGTLPVVDPVAMQVEPASRETIYLASARGALFRSTTGARSWVELTALPRPVRRLAAWLEPTLPVLAAAAGEGLWRLALPPTLPASAEPAANNRRYFTESKHNVSPAFYPFFVARGGLERFGLPRTEEFYENGTLVQYFQRARLERRPEHRGTVYEIQISLLGETLVGGLHPPVEPFESSQEQRYFEETGHIVSYAFLRHWNTRGGLDSFGFPITEELQVDGRPVQYFQRARLEYRVEAAGTRDEVQVGDIGDEILRQRGWLD
jgi:photosystem II stability/assembly factor-like uncharacterized protein